MSEQELKRSRSAAWIEILGRVEQALEQALGELSRREQAISDGKTACAYDIRLAESSKRWSGLWLRSAAAEQELNTADTALVTAEQELRSRLDDLVACRQNLAHWLNGALG